MRMPILWHEQCYLNARSSLDYELEVLRRQQAKVDDMAKRVEFKRRQLVTAKAEGRDTYDNEQFLIRRKAQ